MSWAAHEFENYFIQRHLGTRVSFLALVSGALAPDLFTKAWVYESGDPAQFHRGWPGAGFTHSLLFGVVLGVAVLALSRNRPWAVGILVGHWAHVLTDTADSAGVMLFFPFSTEPVAFGKWNYAAAAGRHGDAVAYYSSLGGVWDLAWLVVTLTFAFRVLRRDYFRDVVVPADPQAWGWLQRVLHLPEPALLLLYRGLLFYGAGRMVAWFLYARFDVRAPFELAWAGPSFVGAIDLSDASFVEVAARTGVGGLLFAALLWTCWLLFVRRLWQRATPALVRIAS